MALVVTSTGDPTEPPSEVRAAVDPPAGDDGAACAPLQRVVAFHLGGQSYAFPLSHVREVQQIVAFSEVPSGGAGTVGMVNLRGLVIPAIDVRLLVGLEPCEYTIETPMIIAEVQGEKLALIVDDVQDVFEVPPDCLQAAPTLHRLSAFMIGVARLDDGLVYVLDLDRLFDAAAREGGEA